MPANAAAWIVRAVLIYLAAGLVFAVPFAFKLAGRLDPAARRGTPGFRLLIVPGAVLLWPWLLRQILRDSRAGSS